MLEWLKKKSVLLFCPYLERTGYILALYALSYRSLPVMTRLVLTVPQEVCYILDIHLLESFYQESHDQESHNQEHVISEIEMYMEFMKYYILSI